MKKAFLFLSIIFLCLELKGQTDKYYDPDDRPKFYLGIGTGFNTYTGLAGLSGNYIIDSKLFLQGGFGLSTWGFKSSLGLRYDQSYRNGFTFGANLTISSGIEDIDLEVVTANGATREVNMLLERAGTINLKTGYNWWIGEYNTINLNVGYSFEFKRQPWVVNDGTSLSVPSQQALEIIAPGGIIFGLGLTFGVQ